MSAAAAEMPAYAMPLPMPPMRDDVAPDAPPPR